MRSVEELERSLLEGARKELAPSASDRMRMQTLLLGNEAWFQPAPVRRNSLRSLARSWRGGVALGFALGALIGFGASRGLDGLVRGSALPPELAPLPALPAHTPPALAPAASAAPEPAAPEPAAPEPAAPEPAAPEPAAPEPAAPAPPSAVAGLDGSAAQAGPDDRAESENAAGRAVVARREAVAHPGQRAAAADENRSTLAQELALLQRARRALNRRDARLALGIVQSLDERFPDGVLMQERAATRILSLCQLERADEARSQGQHFLAAHPRSVYAERVRRSCAGKQ